MFELLRCKQISCFLSRQNSERRIPPSSSPRGCASWMLRSCLGHLPEHMRRWNTPSRRGKSLYGRCEAGFLKPMIFVSGEEFQKLFDLRKQSIYSLHSLSFCFDYFCASASSCFFARDDGAITTRIAWKHPPDAREDCWGHCGSRGGYCDWCGVGNACCRQNEARCWVLEDSKIININQPQVADSFNMFQQF